MWLSWIYDLIEHIIFKLNQKFNQKVYVNKLLKLCYFLFLKIKFKDKRIIDLTKLWALLVYLSMKNLNLKKDNLVPPQFAVSNIF